MGQPVLKALEVHREPAAPAGGRQTELKTGEIPLQLWDQHCHGGPGQEECGNTSSARGLG